QERLGFGRRLLVDWSAVLPLEEVVGKAKTAGDRRCVEFSHDVLEVKSGMAPTSSASIAHDRHRFACPLVEMPVDCRLQRCRKAVVVLRGDEEEGVRLGESMGER